MSTRPVTAQRPTRRPEWGLGLPRALTAASGDRTAHTSASARRMRVYRDQRAVLRENKKRWDEFSASVAITRRYTEDIIREREPIVTPRTLWWVWAAVGVGLGCSGAGILLWATQSAG